MITVRRCSLPVILTALCFAQILPAQQMEVSSGIPFASLELISDVFLREGIKITGEATLFK